MKTKNRTFFSVLLLLLFVSSLSANTYSSLNCAKKNTFHFSKNIEVTQNAFDSVTEDLIFEETEDNCKNDFETKAHIIPFHSALLNLIFIKNLFSSFAPVLILNRDSIFISVCNFRL